MRGKKILVAGGSGLVGTHLVKRLLSLGADVSATYWKHPPAEHSERFTRADLTDPASATAVTQGKEYVILAAAETFGAKMIHEQPTKGILTNLAIGINILEACRLNRIQKFIFIGSATVYQETDHPIREEEFDLNKPVYDFYLTAGTVNRYLEGLCGFYKRKFGLSIGMIRTTNIYGPNEKFDPEKSHVLPALIRRAVDKEDPFIVWGDGSPVRDFIYVEDFIDDLLTVLEKYCVGEPINVANGTPVTIREAVEVVLAVTGHKVKPTYDPTKPSAIPYRMIGTEKFNRMFGKPKRTPLKEGIKKMLDWYTLTCR